MKRLLIFDPCLSTYRIDLYNALSRKFSVSALLTGSRSELNALGFDIEAVKRQATFPYRYHSKGLRLGNHLISRIYFRIIKQFRPDIILVNELGVNTLMAILFKRTFKYRIFSTVDDSPDIVRGYGLLRSLLRKFVIRHVEGFIVVNPEVRDWLTEKFKRSTCAFYYLPIIQNDEILAAKFRAALPLSREIFEKHSFAGKKIILFVGRLIDIKMPNLLLEVFDGLHRSNRELQLIFTGDGALENSLREYVSAHSLHSAVHFTGRLTGNDLYAWYNIGQILVLPSRLDRFGAVVNEALVAGCYTVVSNSVGAACLVNDTNGAIFKTEDHNSLKNALLKTLEKIEPLTTVKAGSSRMSEPFSVAMDKFIEFIS